MPSLPNCVDPTAKIPTKKGTPCQLYTAASSQCDCFAAGKLQCILVHEERSLYVLGIGGQSCHQDSTDGTVLRGKVMSTEEEPTLPRQLTPTYLPQVIFCTPQGPNKFIIA